MAVAAMRGDDVVVVGEVMADADRRRFLAGGAVAGGLVPLSLGSDTNGSIRVPSSFCGLFGLKPTYGRLSRARSFPFVSSFDHLGPLTRSTRDLALAYDAMQGADADDPACAATSVEPVTAQLARGLDGLRIAVAGGHFRTALFPEAIEAVARVTRALGVTREVELPEAARARAAAYVISTVEGASLHLDRLRHRPADFDPAVRDRLIAGALVPGPFVERAQKFRRWYRDQVLHIARFCDAQSLPCIVRLQRLNAVDRVVLALQAGRMRRVLVDRVGVALSFLAGARR